MTHGRPNAARSANDERGDGTSAGSSLVRELFNNAFSRAYDAEVVRLRKERA
jgi:hypothetical protein